jgi:serine/threonine protein kinase
MAKTSMTISLTEGYAPIEQYRDKGNFGPHTDVYALAATLYYLLTADGLKRDSKSTPAPAYKREQIKTFDFLVKPKVYNQSLSQRVNDAILEGMELEPENRTPTVLKFRENLGLVNIENEQEIQLKSEVGINYTKLRDLLTAQKWEEADKETYEVMIKAVGKRLGDWFTSDELLNFPCQDLSTIDQLWVKYSQEKFGFSVQKEIYLSVGGKLGSYEYETFKRFYETVGVVDGVVDIKYCITPPRGHLPLYPYLFGISTYSFLPSWGLDDNFWGLFSRIETCKL